MIPIGQNAGGRNATVSCPRLYHKATHKRRLADARKIYPAMTLALMQAEREKSFGSFLQKRTFLTSDLRVPGKHTPYKRATYAARWAAPGMEAAA